MIREEIKNLIQKSIRELQKEKVFPKFDIPEIKIEHPEEKAHGDYATNIAMVIAKQVKKNPMEIAKAMMSNVKCQMSNVKLLEKIELKKPGFINFFLSKEYLQKEIGEILKAGEKFGQLELGKKANVNLEFISANPNGLLHIGNGRGAFFGDALARVLEKTGYKVTREYYINDAKVNTQIKILGKTGTGEGTTYLNDYLRHKIQNSKFKIQNYKSKFKINESLHGEVGHLLAREIQKDIKNFIEKKLKIKFDNWVSEEWLYRTKRVDKMYQWLKNKNLIYKKEKAEWLKATKFGGPQDWVVIREAGEPTYLLTDIAYHKDKFDRSFPKIINIWGADHQGHVPKIKVIAKILGFKGQLDILISQVVRLKKGKISKRKGEIVTLKDLINEVGLDVARFLYLTKSLNTQMEFDLELAKEQSEKNPVYYIQYAHARICSIIKKLKIKNEKLKITIKNLKLLSHSSEIELIKQLIRFPEIIEDTANDYQVQRIPQYAIDLATIFHQFYRDCKVLSDNRELTQARLGFILATKIVLKNTLDLMGISAPEKM